MYGPRRGRAGPSTGGRSRPTTSSGPSATARARPPRRRSTARVAALDLLLGADQSCHGDRLLDLGIGAAAAEVSGHRVPDLLRGSGTGSPRRARPPRRSGRACRSRTGARRPGRTPRRADGRAAPRSSSPRGRRRCDERDAREHRDAVELHGARAAVTLAAGDLRPGQAELVAQDVGERAADRRVDRLVVAVDVEAQAPDVTAMMSARWTRRNVAGACVAARRRPRSRGACARGRARSSGAR